MILNNYLEQHESIRSQVEVIKELSNCKELEENAAKLGTEISKLAGIIKIHLSSEDKYMYPKLIESTDVGIQKKAKSYHDEMGDLMEVFTSFKEKYNTKPRILENRASFEKDLKEIVAQLSKRMDREEKDLYKFI